MVEEDMGVGIVPLQSVKEEVEKGKLIRWWIEGAEINWELGIAQLSNGYDSPIMQKFVALAHKDFVSEVAAEGAKKGKSKARVKK
jgi:DNA-binding transcriptional LysR family regulator